MPAHEHVARKPSPKTELLPEGFDPRQFPVISRHWFGIEPLAPREHVSSPLARAIDRLQIIDESKDEAA